MKRDTTLRSDVIAELEWNSGVDSRTVGVAVTEGVVTLSGAVASCAERHATEAVVKAVAGVRAVVNELTVFLPFGSERSDSQIAEAAALALELNTLVPRHSMQISVQRGWLTLSGIVQSSHQRNAAEAAVRYLRGVKGVTVQLRVMPQSRVHDIKTKIEATFRRHALADARSIHVSVLDGIVTLEGQVHNWQEWHNAEAAAWSGGGVVSVKNRLFVSP